MGWTLSRGRHVRPRLDSGPRGGVVAEAREGEGSDRGEGREASQRERRKERREGMEETGGGDTGWEQAPAPIAARWPCTTRFLQSLGVQGLVASVAIQRLR